MKKRGRGRPKENVKLITLDQAVQLIKDTLMEMYHDSSIVERMSYSKGTLYNFRSNGKITCHGSANCALVDAEEIIDLCG